MMTTFDLPDDDVRHEALIAPRRAFVPLPGTVVIERPDWFQVVTPSLPEGGLNDISYCNAAESQIEALIDEGIARYQGGRYRWTVGPDTRPRDLGQRLERRGLIVSATVAMARNSAGFTADPAPGIRIELIDESTVDDFTAVMARGWSIDPGPLDALHRNALSTAPARLRMFVAYAEGQPAAAAAYFAFTKSAYLLGGVVLPQYRGRGLYRALVATRMAEASGRGLVLATSHARETTSYPILHRLDFEPVCRLQVYAPP